MKLFIAPNHAINPLQLTLTPSWSRYRIACTVSGFAKKAFRRFPVAPAPLFLHRTISSQDDELVSIP